MSDKTGIEWTDASWNPIVGCSIVSPGCTNCYAMRMAARLHAIGANANYKQEGIAVYRGLTKEVNGSAVWTGKVALAAEHILTAPLRWKRPHKIFVNSMGDLFHESVPDEWIDRVFAVMALCPKHTFQVLTKRADRMLSWFGRRRARSALIECLAELYVELPGVAATWPFDVERAIFVCKRGWPLPNVWLGVSAERQQEADERIPYLLQTPAAVQFVSCEPLLGPIDLNATPLTNLTALFPNGEPALCHLDWIIVGGESGPGARPMHPQWARDIRDQCTAAGVPYFFKQHGEWVSVCDRDIDDPDWRRDYTVTKHQPERYRILNLAGGWGFHGDRVQLMRRVGKARAGRLLDGAEHNEFPDIANSHSLPNAPTSLITQPDGSVSVRFRGTN